MEIFQFAYCPKYGCYNYDHSDGKSKVEQIVAGKYKCIYCGNNLVLSVDQPLHKLRPLRLKRTLKGNKEIKAGEVKPLGEWAKITGKTVDQFIVETKGEEFRENFEDEN